ncbi:ABC transporter ATP-binding protein [Anaerocolumna cellulosilytica]|uniref:ABC transporter ATP-binding protein n=1 Tax=Anaerocolumna cellulosilytica TaxID=433286 RepID=A0A6S6QT74_9FIRM|nr:ABC transporter ATP-binding protein [Anaerocolumna cellulosilytica]MBB5194254.1 ABC-2 type transport system ATP-binding protein [Anaerocolumna cellulosilytica]BCJ94533.1 ABC transporter ATP-binding protein [Anaerocolumna cellulosilytica]
MILQSNNLVKKYMSKTAVNGITLDIEAGKVYALLGPNGSGKTTWMKMVAGLVKPTSGTITYKGISIGIESKSKIAYMSTEPFFYNYMTVKDVGKYYKDFFSDFDEKRYEELIERMELSMKDKAKSLSSGMAAKLKIAATMARKAELYMLDEPLNGIDIIARERIITTILEVTGEEATLIISSHLVDELEKIIDNAIFVKKGTIAMNGEAEELRLAHGKSIVELYKEVYA